MKINLGIEIKYKINDECYILVDRADDTSELLKGIVEKVLIKTIITEDGIDVAKDVIYTVRATLPKMNKDEVYHEREERLYKTADAALRNMSRNDD